MEQTGDIIACSNIAFGTSGARGLVTDFSSLVVQAFALNFIEVMETDFQFKKICIGIDNRPSSYFIAQNIQATIQQKGYVCEFMGILPTPALALYSGFEKCPAIMVTGSHIPFDRNGLKFYSPEGEISKKQETLISSLNVQFNKVELLEELKSLDFAKRKYIERNFLGEKALLGWRIGIYEHSSSGRDIYSELFESMGAEVVRIERSEHFVPIDTEAVPEQLKTKSKQWASDYKLDAVFSTDGDGDRPMLADENGVWLKGDVLCILACKALGIKNIALPVSCNTVAERCEEFNLIERTKIGSPYVIEALARIKTQTTAAGFEANGGFLLSTDAVIKGKKVDALETRDALLPVLAVLDMSNENKLSTLSKSFLERFTESGRVQGVDKSSSEILLNMIMKEDESVLETICQKTHSEIAGVCKVDGLRLTFKNDDIIHFRQSGNAPELRCYVESATQQGAKELLENCISNINQFLSKV